MNAEKKRAVIAAYTLPSGRVRCHWCGESGERSCFTVDHIVAKAAGGTGARDNLVAACVLCNGAKSCLAAVDFTSWLASYEGRMWLVRRPSLGSLRGEMEAMRARSRAYHAVRRMRSLGRASAGGERWAMR